MLKVKDRFNSYVLVSINAILVSTLIYLLYKFDMQFSFELLTSITPVVFCLFLLNYFSLTTILNETSINFSYMFFRKTIFYNEIREIHIENVHAFSKFSGWGYRINFSGEIGYILNSGNCIKVTTIENKVYYISFNKKYLQLLLNNDFIKITLN